MKMKQTRVEAGDGLLYIAVVVNIWTRSCAVAGVVLLSLVPHVALEAGWVQS